MDEVREWWLVVSDKSSHSCVCDSYQEAKQIAEVWNIEYPGLAPYECVQVREI